MIWTFKIEFPFYGDINDDWDEQDWVRVIEINSTSTLEDFHFVIQQAIDFDNDHLYEFFLSKTARSQHRESFDDENGEIYELTLEDLYPLEKGEKLFYLFDYGDQWLFKITKSRKKPHRPETGTKYPRLIESVGENPEQYPSGGE